MTVKTITAAELFDKMGAQKELVLVDVRAEEKYNDYHIEHPGGIHIPKIDIFKLAEEPEQTISSLPMNQELIITCTTGNSATKCANILSSRSYDVAVLEGGITAWKEFVSKKSITDLWAEFKQRYPNAPDSYEAWAFGDSTEMADELAKLVLEGKKTATASNYTLYSLENEPLPTAGLHNVILDGDGKAIAIVETTDVTVVPFDEVTEEQAYLEGEGDRSLTYWRDVHETFFAKELEGIGQRFHQKMPVVCEKFKVVYKK
ncbi:ASCH domain-containing protein [Sporosarcina oncorhynchi]|uniref:ASCH domain-containing protein n=1 Tax=Sporosarcina oncorhynchi TaxID=3056444 RepID=UPI00295F5745|nr:ASCH domain-containing protein [Sporosarcina sp. T2O-4]